MQLLIVANDEALRAALRDLLTPAFPQIRILGAATGTDALAICRQERPQLVLTYLRLPDIDGIQLAERLRAHSPAPAVIVVSLFGGQEHAARARCAGACAFITQDRLASELAPAVAWALGIPISSAGSAA